MLPACEEAHEIRAGDGFDFAPQAPQGEAMNARQQPAVAPFDFTGRRIGREMAAQHLAFGFQLGQSGIHFIARQR